MKSSAVALLVVSLAVATPAVAQPFAGGGAAPGGMPNLRAIAGHPLPDRGMPAGTVSVRVGRKTPANAVAGVEITIVTKNAGGDARMRKGTTDAGGRAIFESLAPGDEFHAEVTVDGETLKTDTFAIPAEGGVRTMLIAGLGPAPAQGDDEAGAPAADGAPAGGADAFALGSATGTVKPEASLPKGTLEVRLFDESGRGVPNQPITLGAVDQTNKVTVLHAQTNGEGTARFTALPTGRTSGYAAVADWHGQHIGTEPFALPEDTGARAEIHTLERTEPIHTAASADFGVPGPIIDFQAPLQHTLVKENVHTKGTWEKMYLEGRPPINVGVTSNGDIFGGTQVSFGDVLGDKQVNFYAASGTARWTRSRR